MQFPELIQKEIETIVESIKKTVDCEKIYLFGSYAYGTPHKYSDLDFYVIMPDGTGNPWEVMRNIHLNFIDLQKTMPIDVLADHSSRFFERSVLPTMEMKIANDGILLYDRLQ